MGNKILKKKKQQKARSVATVGYILPFAVSLIILILFLLPCFYFTDYSGDAKEMSSIFSRISENFSAARNALLGSASVDEAYKSFSSLIITACVTCMLCFIFGLAVSFFYMITGLTKLYAEQKSDKLRRIFVTVIPNKTVVCLLSLLTVVPSFFPLILVKTIDRTLMIYTKVHYLAGDLIIYCIILWLTPILFFVFTKKYENREFNIFAKKQSTSFRPNHPQR